MTDDKLKPKDVVFPEKIVLIVNEILEKYNLIKTDKELGEKFSIATTPKEENNILKEMPSVKIAEILRKYQLGTTKLEDFPKMLKENLNVSQKDAEGITEELKKAGF